MSDFWARQLNGGQAPPPHLPQPVPQAQPTGPAWWMTPAHPGVNPGTPPPSHPGTNSGVDNMQYTYQQLKSMRADQMSQDQMEALAVLELQFQKYNNACDQCGSVNFLPSGAKIGNIRMPTSKCFECGNSSGVLTASPEPAVGGSGKPGRQTLQLGGGTGSYGLHHSQLPAHLLPRNV